MNYSFARKCIDKISGPRTVVRSTVLESSDPLRHTQKGNQNSINTIPGLRRCYEWSAASYNINRPNDFGRKLVAVSYFYY